MPWPLAIAIAFLCGSIPFGLLIARARGLDIRQHGSRNIGATNVGRVLGRPWGVACFMLDAGKGFAPVAAAGIAHGLWGRAPCEMTSSAQWLWLATAVAALLGHLFPPWLRFRGGKGVATGFGALLAIWPTLTVAALVALALWIVCVVATRYVSVASIVAGVSVPMTVAISAALGPGGRAGGVAAAVPFLVGTSLLAVLVVWRHRANMARLLHGEELRVGRKKERQAMDRTGT
ncbi:MAG: glycerol-3-phosphate 1-O-acyltransferase PlsY [Phycisphaerales bacterium]|jgi:glycerol-3-phosphate acyltransferase PlsY